MQLPETVPVNYNPFLKPVDHDPFQKLAMAGKLPGMDVSVMPEAPGESLGGGAGPGKGNYARPDTHPLSREVLENLIANKKLSFEQIARQYGVTRNTVVGRANRLGIGSTRKAGEFTEEGLQALKEKSGTRANPAAREATPKPRGFSSEIKRKLSLPSGTTPSMPKTNLPMPSEEDIKAGQQMYKLVPVDHDPFKE